jgi:response regulator RpfG family c-di-GMP phosphodiesterase
MLAAAADRTVVVVDDDDLMRVYLSETLSAAGYRCRSFHNGSAALGWLVTADESIDLLFSDIDMPGMNGLDLLRTVKTIAPDLPVILVSGMCDLPIARSALRAGASDYLLKPVRPADLLALTARHVELAATAQMEAVRTTLQRTLGQGDLFASNHARRLMPIFDALGFKRFETLQHSRRVAAFAVLLGKGLGIEGDRLRSLEIGSLLHDIGKAGIPHNVIMKPGKLSDSEWAIVKLHPGLGVELLRGIPGLDEESQIVHSHHERFDGKGYPRQLAGDQIPLGARIFSVADTLDAIASDRCYRLGQSVSAARAEIARASGSQFDPSVVGAFESIADRELESILREFPDAA